MGFALAFDLSKTMGLDTNGRLMNADNPDQTARITAAAEIADHLLKLTRFINLEPTIGLFTIGNEYMSLGDVEAGDNILSILTNALRVGDIHIGGFTDISHFLRHITNSFLPTHEDKIIIFTDSATAGGAFNYNLTCEVRFVICNTNKESMSEVQLEELDEISATSLGLEMIPENESLYHHFHLNDWQSKRRMARMIFDEMFEMSVYTLTLGHMNTKIKISHTFYKEGAHSITILGFCKPQAIQNIEAASTHYCHAAFYLDENETVEGLPRDGGDSDATDMVDTEVETTDSNPSEEEEVERAPRVNFFPQQVITTLPIAGEETATEAPAAAAAPADEKPAEPAPVRKFKVVSKTGEQRDYVRPDPAAKAAAAAAAAPAATVAKEDKPQTTKPKAMRLKKTKRKATKAEKLKKKQEKREKKIKARALQAKYTAEVLRQVQNMQKREEKELEGDMDELIAISEALDDADPEQFELTNPEDLLEALVEIDVEQQKALEAKKKAAEENETKKSRKRKIQEALAFKLQESQARAPRDVPEAEVETAAAPAAPAAPAPEPMEVGKKEEVVEKKEGEEKNEEAAGEQPVEQQPAAAAAAPAASAAAERPSEAERLARRSDTRRAERLAMVSRLINRHMGGPFQMSRLRFNAPEIRDCDLTTPYLVQMLAKSLREEDAIALCLLNTGEYGVFTSEANSDGHDLLMLSILPDQSLLPECVPNLAQLETETNEDATVANDQQISQPVGNENPSYIAAHSSWFNENGIEADFVRIRKNLKKLNERLPHFYMDVNRMRHHAYTICNQELLPALAEQLIEEGKLSGSDQAVKHCEYVATFFRDVIPLEAVRDIPMPNFEE